MMSNVDFGIEILETDNTTEFQRNVMFLLAQICRDQTAMKEEMRRRAHRDPFPRGMR